MKDDTGAISDLRFQISKKRLYLRPSASSAVENVLLSAELERGEAFLLFLAKRSFPSPLGGMSTSRARGLGADKNVRPTKDTNGRPPQFKKLLVFCSVP